MKKMEGTYTEIEIYSSSKIHIFSSADLNHKSYDTIGIFTRTVWIDKKILNDGFYFVNLNLLLAKSDIIEKILIIEDAVNFEIVIPEDMSELDSSLHRSRKGLVLPSLEWTNS